MSRGQYCYIYEWAPSFSGEGKLSRYKDLGNIGLPDPEEFRRIIEKCEEEWGISDCIYIKSIDEFSRVRLDQLAEKHEVSILRPFLLTWGSMVRVLGKKEGTKAILMKLKEISHKLEPLREKDFSSVDLNEIKDLIVELFDEIRETEFENRKRKQKKVGSTAASKVLHLTCPDLFFMWDLNIRNYYEKNKGDGKEYFDFLTQMKEMCKSKELETTIGDLQRESGKKITRMIDQYNWVKARPESNS